MKAKNLLPIILMVVFAVSRWPGLLPNNFSAAYAMMFCAGVFFPKRLIWLLFATMLATDLMLNRYYHAALLGPEMIGNYLAYAGLAWLGRSISAKAPWYVLLGGGLMGAILFYFISNTFSWLFNPYHNAEYTKNFAGWLCALTMGIKGWPETWEFFRNTFTSSGLFTGLFVGAMKILEALEPKEEEEKEEAAPAEQPAEQPEEAKASS